MNHQVSKWFYRFMARSQSLKRVVYLFLLAAIFVMSLYSFALFCWFNAAMPKLWPAQRVLPYIYTALGGMGVSSVLFVYFSIRWLRSFRGTRSKK